MSPTQSAPIPASGAHLSGRDYIQGVLTKRDPHRSHRSRQPRYGGIGGDDRFRRHDLLGFPAHLRCAEGPVGRVQDDRDLQGGPRPGHSAGAAKGNVAHHPDVRHRGDGDRSARATHRELTSSLIHELTVAGGLRASDGGHRAANQCMLASSPQKSRKNRSDELIAG